jgi:putative membrane protein
VALFSALPRRFHIVVTLDWVPNRLVLGAMSFATRVAEWPVILRPDALAHLGARSVFNSGDVLSYRRRGLKDAARLLAAGRLLVIFPEGYPTIDPHFIVGKDDTEMLSFRRGFIAVAAAGSRLAGTDIPLVPVGLSYSKGKRWEVAVNFGKPLHARDFVSRKTLVQELEHEVARLSGLTRRTGGSSAGVEILA